MNPGPGRPGSLAHRRFLPFSSVSFFRSAWRRSLREWYCHELGLFSLSLSLFFSLSPGLCLSILPHLFIVAISACAASLSHLFSLLAHYLTVFRIIFVGKIGNTVSKT